MVLFGPGVPPAAARTPAGAARMSETAPRLASSNDHRSATLRITLYSSTIRQDQCQKCQIERQERARPCPVAGPLAASGRAGLQSAECPESESPLLVGASADLDQEGRMRPGPAELTLSRAQLAQRWPTRGGRAGRSDWTPVCPRPTTAGEVGCVPPIRTCASPARSLPTDANLSPSSPLSVARDPGWLAPFTGTIRAFKAEVWHTVASSTMLCVSSDASSRHCYSN